MSLFERIRNQAKRALPSTLEKIECAVDPFPVRQVKERVGNGFGIAALENVLGRQNETLLLEEILRHVRVELDRAVNSVDGAYFGRA